MENNQNSKSEPIEREFYVLTVDKLNKKSRIHIKQMTSMHTGTQQADQ